MECRDESWWCFTLKHFEKRLSETKTHIKYTVMDCWYDHTYGNVVMHVIIRNILVDFFERTQYISGIVAQTER